jgi:hypothetical protein
MFSHSLSAHCSGDTKGCILNWEEGLPLNVDIPPDIATGKFYMVDFVKMTLELKEVFVIKGKGYFICYFRIV